MYYQLYYPEPVFIICASEVQGINKTSWFRSNVGIERVMGELMRCGSQFKEIFQANNCEK